MKKSIFVVVVLLAMVMASSLVFAQYEDIQIVPTISDSYAYGTVGAQLYYNSKGVWVKQVKLYNGTPTPGYDNPVWEVAEAMTLSNTIVASSNTQLPVPHIFAADVTVQPPIKLYVYGDSVAVSVVKNVLLNSGVTLNSCETGTLMVPSATGTFNMALVYSATSGMVFYIPVADQYGHLVLNPGRLKALIAADSFTF